MWITREEAHPAGEPWIIAIKLGSVRVEPEIAHAASETAGVSSLSLIGAGFTRRRAEVGGTGQSTPTLERRVLPGWSAWASQRRLPGPYTAAE